MTEIKMINTHTGREEPTIVNLIDPDGILDKMEAVYRNEYSRWSVRRIQTEPPRPDRFQLVRNTSPEGNTPGEYFEEVVKLTARECSSSYGADSWLRTYAGRSAMKAVTDIIANGVEK